MARYIDADMLKELIDGGYDIDFSELPETKAALLHLIDYQDTADVRENVRGEWIDANDPVNFGEFRYKCSICGASTVEWADNFCYRCGADMRGNHG